MRVCVLGAGSWGTTIAALAAAPTDHRAGSDTMLWCRSAELASSINETRSNQRYLAGFELPERLVATADIGEAIHRADFIVVAVPSVGFRATLETVADAGIDSTIPLVSLTKGLEAKTNLRMTEVCRQVLTPNPAGALTGPNLAKEILGGAGTASVVAIQDQSIARLVQHAVSTSTFRIYVNDDVVGCELGGALKNVIALASGMADGLGAGSNTRAAIMTRGLAELSRLGQSLGGRADTFAGLAGMGDLIATCISPQSRNRFVGEQLARGRTIEEVTQDMDQVAEGVRTAPVARELARAAGVEMPITDQVVAVVEGRSSAADAYRTLLDREPRADIETRP